MRRSSLLALLVLLISSPAFSDEGMWTFHDFPHALVKREHGVDLSGAWLDQVRTATIRLSNCTASFVSAEGLILTNHHCAEALPGRATRPRGHNLVGDGFLRAHARAGAQVRHADRRRADGDGKRHRQGQCRHRGPGRTRRPTTQRKKALTQLEQPASRHAARQGRPRSSARSVDLYEGGQYWLYKYQRYNDVRLVFAPERGIAAFGGDPDNFQFPRWCLDMSVLRAYEQTASRPPRPTSCAFNCNGPQRRASWCSSPGTRAPPTGC